jgi:hypothetical protein
LEAPVALRVEGAKGLFVEASPFARAVFEAEQAAAGPGANPRWWGIRVSPTANWSEVELAARLAGLGVGAVLAREPVSERLLALASSREPIGAGYTWIRLRQGFVGGSGDWAALPPVPSAALPARGVGVTDVARNAAGDRVSVRFAAGTTGRAVLLTFAHSDWAIESGSGRLYRVPLDPRAGIMAPLLGLEGTGTIVLSHRPRSEEWAGLAIGLLTALAVAARTITRRRREAR